MLAINISGPATISQTVAVGPGGAPAAHLRSGGTTCQLSLNLPAGTYAGTYSGTSASPGAYSQSSSNGNAAVAFTVSSASNNSVNLALGGVPAQLAVVPANVTRVRPIRRAASISTVRGAIRSHVEMLDANQNVIIGGGPATFALTQSGGLLSLPVSHHASDGIESLSTSIDPAQSNAGADGV